MKKGGVAIFQGNEGGFELLKVNFRGKKKVLLPGAISVL